MEKYFLINDMTKVLSKSRIKIFDNKKNFILKREVVAPLDFELFEFFISNGDVTLNLDANNKYKLKDVSTCIAKEKIQNKEITLPKGMPADIYFDFGIKKTGGAYIEDFHSFSSRIYFDNNIGWLQIGKEYDNEKSYICSEGIIICEARGEITTIFIDVRSLS